MLFTLRLAISSRLPDYSGKPKALPDPNVLAQEIVEDLEAALEQFREIATDCFQARAAFTGSCLDFLTQTLVAEKD